LTGAVSAALILLALAAAPATAAPASHRAAPPAATASTDPAAALTAARITFYTADDDKDFDTALNIQVLDPGGAVAGITNIPPNIIFHDDSTNGPYELQVNPGFTAGNLNNGSVRLAVTPYGNDTWRFSFKLDLDFADHTSVPVLGNYLTLSESSRVLSVPMITVGLVAVPSLMLRNIDRAKARLRSVGLVLGRVDYAVDPFCNSIGTVKDQTPSADVLVPTGTSVDITIGTKPSDPCP
jgi:predicted lipoprotein with Yx(FWY)xxD motif